MKRTLALLTAFLMLLSALALTALAEPSQELADALNIEGGELEFETGGEYPMVAATLEDGRTVAKSSNQDVHSSSSALTLSVHAERGHVLGYEASTSSEIGYDKLTFSINGSLVAANTMSGVQSWKSFSYIIPETGDYTFEWKYTKDVSTSRYDDAAMIDNVSLLPPIRVTGIEFSEPEADVFLDLTGRQLTPNVLPENASNKAVTWASGNESVAVVNDDGFVSPVSEGSAVITATTVDGGFSASITVNVIDRGIIFKEEFENGLGSWISQDSDGDYYRWYHSTTSGYSHEGSGYMVSRSFNSDPDNWLITPDITIPEGGSFKLEYHVCSGVQPNEHYGLYVGPAHGSVNSVNLSSYTKLLDETLTSTVYENRVVDLSEYAGQTISLAWRHYESPDVWEIRLDTVTVYRSDDGQEPLMGDVDLDGSITAADAILILRHALAIMPLSDDGAELADVNGDGAIDIIDALIVLRAAQSGA